MTLLKLLDPDAITMLFIAAMCFIAYAYPARKDGFVWLIWLIIGILAIVAWGRIVFF